MSNSIFPWTWPIQWSETRNKAPNQIKELLIKSETSQWAYGKPEIIELLTERTGQERINESRDALYIWEPTEADITRLSADGTQIDEFPTVQVLIWSLDETTAMQHQSDVIQILGSYMDDNKQETNFNNIEPTSREDLRNERMANRADHFVMGVTVSMRRKIDIE